MSVGCGLSPSHAWALLERLSKSDKTDMSARTALKIAQASKVSFAWLVLGEGAVDATTPVVEVAAANVATLELDAEQRKLAHVAMAEGANEADVRAAYDALHCESKRWSGGRFYDAIKLFRDARIGIMRPLVHGWEPDGGTVGRDMLPDPGRTLEDAFARAVEALREDEANGDKSKR